MGNRGAGGSRRNDRPSKRISRRTRAPAGLSAVRSPAGPAAAGSAAPVTPAPGPQRPGPPSRQARRHLRTDPSATRRSCAISPIPSPRANRPAASSRSRSRRCCSADVYPPRCAYRVTWSYSGSRPASRSELYEFDLVSGSLLITDVEVQAAACRNRVRSGLAAAGAGGAWTMRPTSAAARAGGKPGADRAQRLRPGRAPGARRRGSPLSTAGLRPRRRSLGRFGMVAEPGVPAEAEGAVDQGLVAADSEIGADLEVGPPSSSLTCL